MRSRSGTAPTRRPGQQLRRQIRRTSALALGALAALLLVLAAVGLAQGIKSVTFIAAITTVLMTIALADRRLSPSLDRRLRGLEGEQRVGAVLDGMHGLGWKALHDVDTGRGNIDHVVVGPGGLVTIETKSHRGRRRVDRLDSRWLGQAYAQKRWLEAMTGMRADCLLVFSDAYLDRQFSRQKGVLVLPARSLEKHLLRRRPVLDAQQVATAYDRLCQALDSPARSSAA